MKYLPLTLALLSGIYLTGCELLDGTSRHEAHIRFIVDKATYRTGEHIVLGLTNSSFSEVGFNLSCSKLEPREGQRLPAAVRDAVCPQYLGILAPGKQTQLSFLLDGALSTGGYRFRTKIMTGRDLGEVDTLYTSVFAVIR